MRVTIPKQILNFLSSTTVVLFFIGLLNLILRIIFINYAYISTDEGIALYNTRLAYEGLRPFIDYNGWNSLINDYLFGIPQVFISSTIITQRYFALFVAALSFVVTLTISYLISGKRSLVWAALFISFGSLTYTYYSNFPYSTEMMTLCVLLTLLTFIISEKTTGRSKLLLEIVTCILANISVLIRSQMLPLPAIIWLLFLLQKKSFKERLNLTIRSLAITILVFLPFLQASWQHTLYGLFWPFFSSKTHLYVANTSPRSIALLSEFVRAYSQDYGLLSILVFSGLAIYMKNFKNYFNQIPRVINAILVLLILFFATSLIHHPADASYNYPAVPLFAVTATFFVSKLLKQNYQINLKKFIQQFIVLIIIMQFLTYPHFKIMKTQLSEIGTRPYDLLKTVNDYVLKNTTINDEILTFYLPAVANIDRKTPLALNEGQGSLTVLDDGFARKFHLTSISMLRNLIIARQVKLIVFTDTFIYYFGETDPERQKTLELIKQNYVLTKEFPDFKFIDGSKANSLMIYKVAE